MHGLQDGQFGGYLTMLCQLHWLFSLKQREWIITLGELKGLGRKRLWPIQRIIVTFAYSDRKTTEIPSQDICCLDQSLKWLPPKCKSETLSYEPACTARMRGVISPLPRMSSGMVLNYAGGDLAILLSYLLHALWYYRVNSSLLK
jgi:hypothetical protein